VGEGAVKGQVEWATATGRPASPGRRRKHNGKQEHVPVVCVCNQRLARVCGKSSKADGGAVSLLVLSPRSYGQRRKHQHEEQARHEGAQKPRGGRRNTANGGPASDKVSLPLCHSAVRQRCRIRACVQWRLARSPPTVMAEAAAHRLPLWDVTPSAARVSIGAPKQATGANVVTSAFVGEWKCTEAALLATLRSLLLRSPSQPPATSELLEEADAVVKLYTSRLFRLALTVVESATAATTADAVNRLSADWFEVQRRPTSVARSHAHATPSPSAPPQRRSSTGAGPSELEQSTSVGAATAAPPPAPPTMPLAESVQSWMLPPSHARRVSPPAVGSQQLVGGPPGSSSGREGHYHVPVMMVSKPVFVPISPAQSQARAQLPHAGVAATPSRRASLGSPVPYVGLLLPPRRDAASGAVPPYDRGRGGARWSMQEGHTVFPASSRASSPAASLRRPSPGPTRVSRRSAPTQLAVGARLPRDSSPSLAASEWLQERRARVSERAMRAAWTVEQRRSQQAMR
jgi:hypothetical protein